MAKAISTQPNLEECRGAVRRRGTPMRSTWWEQDLTQPPEPNRGGGRWNAWTGGVSRWGPREGRSFPPGHPHQQPHQQPHQSSTAEEELRVWRAEWEARDPTAEAELAMRMAEAYLP